MIELVTTRQNIRTVPQRWAKQYANSRYGADKAEILLKLRDLDLGTVAESEVTSIIGNSSWTRITCNACDAEVSAAVVLGQEPDYESSTATICGDCLRKACGMIPENDKATFHETMPEAT